jgi:multicomponent Na+:H+ antiporter subunit A
VAPFIGFLSKELFYEVVLTAPRAALFSILVALLTSLLVVATAGLLGLRPFFGAPRFDHLPHGRVAPGLWLGPLILAILGAGGGLFAGFTEQFLLTPALDAVAPGHTLASLALWHGFSPVLAYSVLTLIGGALIFSRCDALRGWTDNWNGMRRWGPDAAYDRLLAGLFYFATRLTRLLQNGRLRYYLLTVFITATILVGTTLLWRGEFALPRDLTAIRLGDLVLAGIILAAAWITARVGQRLAAIVAMGVVGYGIALIFAQFGAPDLAMTQVSIETMTVLLFVLIIHRLPLFSRLAPRRVMRFDAGVAMAAGLLMTVLTLVALSGHHDTHLSDYFATQSVPAAHGRNIVNTILVDFRALDTLGEITVLGMAGIGVWALLKLWPKDRGNR